MSASPLLRIRDLVVDFHLRSGDVRAVDGVDLDVAAGETVGLVGESGSGKTVTVLAALGLLPRTTPCTVRGTATFDGRDLLAMGARELRGLRGREIGLVFQDPMTSLHPSFRVVDQVAEAMLVHDSRLTAREARRRAVELLERVGVPNPARRVQDYPHQWSGGMRQRAMIAMAMANRPRLLVADEPTTALDVTIQAQILDVLREARDEVGAAALVITHDFGVVAELADRVTVLRSGSVVESAPARQLFAGPRHRHTAALLQAVPRLDGSVEPRRARPADGVPVLDLQALVTHHRSRAGVVHAVDGVDLQVHAGETVGLVGESGCGKTTLARTALRLVDATAGRVVFRGDDITTVRGRRLRRLRRAMSMVFQDPSSSLNPRARVHDVVAEPLRVAGRYQAAGGRQGVHELLERVGLDAAAATRLPAQLSGGQRQRVGIARALALSPDLLVLDEPVSSLDVTTQAQVVALLDRLQRDAGLAYLFVSHDLALVRQISDRVAVMYLGRIVETGTREEVYERPTHPYTQSLLSAVPVPDPDRRGRTGRLVLHGEVPDPVHPPSGCAFRTRCWKATAQCAALAPALTVREGSDHPSACHHAGVAPAAC